MKRYWTILFISLISLSTYAGPLEDGFDAYDRGDYQTAKNLWLPLAKGDNADAQYNMGLLYMKGLGVKKHAKTAMKWFKRAAHFGSADAAYNLGVMYKTGQTGHPSNKDAIYWWKQAADVGHVESMYNMGVMYAYGYGIEKNVERAISYWEQAANKGQPESRQLLYKIYSEGLLGIPVDTKKAYYWQ